MRFFPLLLTGLLLGATLASYGQNTTAGPAIPASKVEDPFKKTILPVPVLFYQQETGAGYGLGVLASGRLGTDTATRASNARAQFWTTQKSQTLIQFVHTIYAPNEEFYANGEISYYKNRLYFFGIGNNSPAVETSHRSFLDFQLFIVNQRLQKRIADRTFLGLQYRFTRTYNINPEPGRVNNDGDNIPVTDPASQSQRNYFLVDPRVTDRSRQNFSLSGIGPVFTLDTRDVILAARHGNLLDLQVMFNGGFIGSQYNFVRYQIDARHFQPIFHGHTTLALQFLGQFNSGTLPWYGLAGIGANLGGTLYDNANLMRGIYEQRFRDRQLMTAQAELRQHLFWRLDGAAFVGFGQVGNNLSDYTFNGIHTAGGLGVRFNFIRRDRVNLRFDYAFGTDPGFYFAIGEAF